MMKKNWSDDTLSGGAPRYLAHCARRRLDGRRPRTRLTTPAVAANFAGPISPGRVVISSVAVSITEFVNNEKSY